MLSVHRQVDIPQVQFWFVVAECPHGPDSAETRGVLRAVTDRVVGLPVVCNDSGGLVQTLSLEVPQLQLFYKNVAFPVVAQRLFPCMVRTFGGPRPCCAVAGATAPCCRCDRLQLLISTAGMRGGFFRALYTGTGPRAVSTGTRLPKLGASTGVYRQRHSSSHPSAPPPPPPHHTTPHHTTPHHTTPHHTTHTTPHHTTPHHTTPHHTTPHTTPPTHIKHDKSNTGVRGTMITHVTFHDGFTTQTNMQHLTKSHTGIGNHLCLRT